LRSLSAEWASKSAHDTHLHSDTLKAAREVVRPLFASKPSHTVVEFPNTKGIFSAPVTEFVTFTLKEGVTMDKLEPLVNQLKIGLVGTQKFYGSSWAPVIDKPNVYHGVLGWESVQVIPSVVPLAKSPCLSNSGTLGCCKLRSSQGDY
jgi:hypothetical protein